MINCNERQANCPLVITMEVDVPESLSFAAKERIAMDLEKYGTVRVVNIEVKNSK